MSGDELNPAAVAQPVEDVQGDGRWMSQVGAIYYWSISQCAYNAYKITYVSSLCNIKDECIWPHCFLKVLFHC